MHRSLVVSFVSFLLLLAVSVSSNSSFSVQAECELPAFSNALPFRYRKQIKRIWIGIEKNTTNCQTQLVQTLKIIDSLPDSLKLRIADYKASQLQNGRTHFLVGLLPQEVMHFSRIMRNRSISEDERVQELRSWASDKLSVDATEYFSAYLKAHTDRVERFHIKVNNLSTEARSAYDRIQAIRREKQTVIDQLSAAAKRELASLWNLKCPHGRRRVPVPESVVGDEGHELDGDELTMTCMKINSERAPPSGIVLNRPETSASAPPPPANIGIGMISPEFGDNNWSQFWQKIFSLHKGSSDA